MEAVVVTLLKLLLGLILGVAAMVTSAIILPCWLLFWIWKRLDQKPPLL